MGLKGPEQIEIDWNPKEARKDPDITRGYHRGNRESVEAHASIALTKEQRREQILGAFVRQPDRAHGWTCDELEMHFGWSHQGVSARLTELKKFGKIVPSDDRRPTRSGRMARVLLLAGR